MGPLPRPESIIVCTKSSPRNCVAAAFLSRRSTLFDTPRHSRIPPIHRRIDEGVGRSGNWMWRNSLWFTMSQNPFITESVALRSSSSSTGAPTRSERIIMSRYGALATSNLRGELGSACFMPRSSCRKRHVSLAIFCTTFCSSKRAGESALRICRSDHALWTCGEASRGGGRSDAPASRVAPVSILR